MAAVSSAAWSPSGRQLAVIRADGIWILTVDSGAIQRLTTLVGKTSLDWSPDGSRLLLALDNSILTISIAGGSVATLLQQPAPLLPPPRCMLPSISGPTWSPNGQLIAYQRDDSCAPGSGPPQETLSVGVIGSDGSDRGGISTQNSSDDLGASLFSWSADSSQLAFIDDETGSTGYTYLSVASPFNNAPLRHLSRNADPEIPAWRRSAPSH